jgi:hypothetical protein
VKKAVLATGSSVREPGTVTAEAKDSQPGGTPALVVAKQAMVATPVVVGAAYKINWDPYSRAKR